MTLPASGAISLFAVNDELGLSHSAQIGLLCTNVRTLFGVASGAVGLQTGYGKSNTSVPGAPTGVSASATSCSAISVSFSAPACTGHLTIDSYQVVCTSSGSNSATGASSPISVTGLSALTSYTFKVRAHNSKGYGCYSSTASATTSAAPSSQSYTTAGTYSWVAPTGVTSVSVVVVSGGGGGGGTGGYNGGGGALAYTNNIAVTPGNSYTVVVGAGGIRGTNYTGYAGGNSSFNGTSVKAYGAGTACVGGLGHGGTVANGTGGAGGCKFGYGIVGGGGAGGYAGKGGTPGYSYSTNPTSGAGGGGAGGGSAFVNNSGGGGGGGVGIFGQGSNGVPLNNGPYGASYGAAGSGGGGGSGGSNGSIRCGFNGGAGGGYGGGGAGGTYCQCSCCTFNGGAGAGGAVRIVWPGNTRTFPSTCVGSP